MLTNELAYSKAVAYIMSLLSWDKLNFIYNFVLANIVYGVIVIIGVMLFVVIFGWVERKVMAKAQFRHGPTKVGPYGFFQNIADALKLLSKENFIPESADKYLFVSSIVFILAILLFSILIVPFSGGIYAVDLSVALLAIFVLLSVLPILIFVAGWSSGNKFGSISAQRSIIMMVSYEMPMLMVIAAVALAAHSFSFFSIVGAQSNMYFAVLMPIGFVVFFIAMLAELERPPFDIREADSELISGWLTDVGAPFYASVLIVDYARMLLGSLLIVLLFFGGWQGPFLPKVAWLLIKVFIVAIFIIVLRATYVRMRLDRLLRFGWLWLLPLSIINLIWVYFFMVWGVIL
ncbi:MAG: complex I subunit 1/NuoH family protein [Candidatus Micrarchaeia archaeon]